MSASLKDTLAEVIRKDSERERRPSDHFKMSSLGHCPRKQVAVRAGLAPTFPPDERSIIKMWLGTQFGKLIQTELEGTGFLVPAWTEREVKYRSYRGHIDGLTREIPDGPAVVEIKTSDDDSIAKYDWSEHYFWQGLGYCLAAGMNKLLVFQIGRNQCLNREKVVFLTPDWKEKIEADISLLESYWETYEKQRTLPACMHRFAWENRTCTYRETKETTVKKEPPKNWNPFEVSKDSKELSDFVDKASRGETKP